MNRLRITAFLLMSLSFGLILGCSGGNGPVTPSETPGNSDDIPIIAMTSNGDVFDALGIMGTYELSLSPGRDEAELISVRNSAIGQSYIVDGKEFFVIKPCTDCFKIKSISLPNENEVMITFTINHPFDPGDPLKPPSGLNRLDLDVFDMTLLIRPIDVLPTSFTESDAYTGIVKNASGYTREIANVISDETALPYILVVDDNADAANTYNEFPMGAEEEFDVTFDLKDAVNFELYLTMGYGSSATKPMRLTPTYYNPEFNKKAAWKVIVAPPNGSDPPDLGNTWNEADSTTPQTITVQVFDWQSGANVDPDLTNPTDVFASSEIASVSLEVPGMHDTLLESTMADSGSGAPDDPYIYTFSLANENLLAAGEYTGFIKVSDERVPGDVIIGGETDTLADSVDGIDLEWVDIPEFATYQSFTATVMAVDPFILETPNGGEIWPIATEQSITWSGGSVISSIKLEYSKDNFVSDINEITASTENDGEFLWEIPDDECDTVKVRVSAESFPWVNDVSDDDFIISIGLDEMIVYCADGPNAGRQIYTIDPEGVGPPVCWTNSNAIFNECAKLSPCGQYIMYTALVSFSLSEIRIIDVSTGVETPINPPGLQTVYSDFSNDGTKIVGACSPIWYEPKELYTFDYSGQNAEQLTTGADAWAPSYSADDSKIYYQGFSSADVYIYDLATGQTTQFTSNGSVWDDAPVANPSMTHIAWATSYNNSCRNVYISPVSSWNTPDFIINMSSCVRSPSFNPDGTKIIVDHGSYGGSELGICTLNWTTGEWDWVNITSNGYGDYQADWGYMIPVD